MKGRFIRWSVDELAFIYLRRAMPRAALHAAFVAWFGRDDVSGAALNAVCKRKGWLTGRNGRFAPGNVPANKGKPCFPGAGGRHPNSRKMQFRPAERRGWAARLYKPIGTERVSKGGYVERKIHDRLPTQSRWRAVHLLRWEEANGPVPEGHCLKCLDGDKSNTEPSNWLLVARALLPRLNGGPHRKRVAYDDAPDELKPTIMAVAKLEHGARSRRLEA
jgi:hypothetical protein